MKKWFFSHDGEVTGPFTQVEAIDFVQQQPNCYGWHPSFTQWLPVSHIGEFADRVPTLESPAQVPKALLTEFSSKRHELSDRIVKMDESIKFTKTYLYELEQEINIYKRLTHTLSDAVKNNIGSIESKYEGYQKTFEDLIYAVGIAKSEIAEVTSEFDNRVEARAKDLASIPTPAKAVPTAAVTPAAPVATVKLKLDADEASAPLDPVPTKAVALDPVATKAISMDPVATKPGSLDPVASKPGSLDPVASKPGAMDPVPMKPSAMASGLASAGLDPVATKPGSLDAVATKVVKADNLAEIDPMSASAQSQAAQATLVMNKDDLASQALLEKFTQNQATDDDSHDELESTGHSGTDAKAAKPESPVKLQVVTSLLKSVLRSDKKADTKNEAMHDSPVTLAHSNDDLDSDNELDEHDDHFDELEQGEKTGTEGGAPGDIAGRMRRRSRRRR